MSQTARNPKVVVLAVFVVALLGAAAPAVVAGQGPGRLDPAASARGLVSLPAPSSDGIGWDSEPAGIGWDSVSLDASAEVKADAMVPRT
ncbi:hypothetical protein OG912_25495 [Streptomyces sp. NBC_00464]|uniref:hypothetical protein n=1 Tax=Streptomyces sp. NBC_00464 TaxID=2975751 RepID=UPI002E173EBD